MILLQCNDPTLLPVISVIQNIFQIIQILGPILAIVSLMILFFRLMVTPQDPDDPKKDNWRIKHSIKNAFIALILLFLIPTLVDLTMTVMGENFSVSSCWKAAKNYKASSSTEYKPRSNHKDKTKVVDNKKQYDKGYIGASISNAEINTTSTKSTNMADALVNLAVAQKNDPSAHGGKKYWTYMGFKSHIQWCACFVGWAMGNTEYNGEKLTEYYAGKGTGSCKSILDYCKKSSKCKYYDQGSGYTPKRGDIIFYTWDNRKSVGHVGIVQYVKDGRVKTIEGNCGDKICEQNMKKTDKR